MEELAPLGSGPETTTHNEGKTESAEPAPLRRLYHMYPLEFVATIAVIVVAIILAITSKGFLELLRIVVSWPVAVVILGLCFGYTFRGILSQWVRNMMFRLSFPGGTQFEVLQSHMPEGKDADSALKSLVAAQARIEELEKQVRDGQPIPPDLWDEIKTLAKIAFHWRLMYFSVYLVPDTKYVLWFISAVSPSSLTLDNYEIAIAHRVYDSNQRRIIWKVLREAGFVEVSANREIRVTEIGLEFLDFLQTIKPLTEWFHEDLRGVAAVPGAGKGGWAPRGSGKVSGDPGTPSEASSPPLWKPNWWE